MSGRRISDMGGMPHTSDMAMKSKTNVKHYRSAEGDGGIDGKYPDTTEDIHRDQEAGVKKMRKHEMKEGYRY